MNISTSPFNEKVKEWLQAVNRMHEEQKITNNEGRTLVLLLLKSFLKSALKQEFEEIYDSKLIQKKDYQSFSEYINCKRFVHMSNERTKRVFLSFEVLRLFSQHLRLFSQQFDDSKYLPVEKNICKV